MKIDVYSLCYNEELLLPYFIRHYAKFASNIYIYDNYSTDRSEEIARNAGLNIIKFNTNNKFDDVTHMNIKNNCWKSSKADWVIVQDMDEFVYHPNLTEILEKTDATIFDLLMYNMFSLVFPTTTGQIYDEIQMGTPFGPYYGPSRKMLLFRPSQIHEISYTPGCHSANPEGNVKICINTDIKFLHMKFLSKEYYIKKTIMSYERFSDHNKSNGYGSEYLYPDDVKSKMFDLNYAITKWGGKAYKVI